MEYRPKNIMKAVGRVAALALLTASMSACDENAWNDEHLDGFEEPEITVKKQVTDTLTSKQVTTIASMKANIDLATANGVLEELRAVAATGTFNSVITPEEYAPAYLDSIAGKTSSKIYYLEKNSTLRLFFPTTDGMPGEMSLIPTATTFTVTDEYYHENVYGGSDDWANCFSPSKPASKYLPGILEEEYYDPGSNPFLVVSYNYSPTDPSFGGSNPPAPVFELSKVVGTIKADGASYSVDGVVTAICQQGFVITDASGSVLVYYGKTFDPADGYAVGQQRSVTGKGGCYNGALQLAPTSDELKGTQEYKYPAPVKADGAKFDALFELFNNAKTADEGVHPELVEVDATEITVSGNYVNYTVAGAQTATGSIYNSTASQREMFKDVTSAKIVGYATSFSLSGSKKFVNLIIVSVNGKAPVYSSPAVQRAMSEVNSEVISEVYKHENGKWAQVENAVVLSKNDYSQMGVSNSLTSEQASRYLPIYLSQKYPYAEKDDEYFVVYNLKGSSETTRNFVSSCTYDGSEWLVSSVYLQMMQFVCSEEGHSKVYHWIYDPSIYIDLPAGKNATSAPFWQKCVDFVYETYDVPDFGSTSITSGVGYVTSYGNNEYFAGTSAYQCNVDIRPAAARKQVPSVYGNMSDEDVQAVVKSNFENIVMPNVLAMEYPEAMPGTKTDQYYVITFTAFDGSTKVHTIRYLVTAPGTFKFTDCTWNE